MKSNIEFKMEMLFYSVLLLISTYYIIMMY